MFIKGNKDKDQLKGSNKDKKQYRDIYIPNTTFSQLTYRLIKISYIRKRF